jgi:hypothetical protein
VTDLDHVSKYCSTGDIFVPLVTCGFKSAAAPSLGDKADGKGDFRWFALLADGGDVEDDCGDAFDFDDPVNMPKVSLLELPLQEPPSVHSRRGKPPAS